MFASQEQIATNAINRRSINAQHEKYRSDSTRRRTRIAEGVRDVLREDQRLGMVRAQHFRRSRSSARACLASARDHEPSVSASLCVISASSAREWQSAPRRVCHATKNKKECSIY